jgi:predicted enzyme related to lactoylglutathione lyase
MSFKIIGPSFLSIQVSDIERSKLFYTEVLGLNIDPKGPPHAYVFKTEPIAFAIREANSDLSASTKLGWGVAQWFKVSNIGELYERVASSKGKIIAGVQAGPFGDFFTFQDPDGYILTAHEAVNEN